MLWSRRSVFLALLVGGPVLLAVVDPRVVMLDPDARAARQRRARRRPALFGMMIWLLYVRFIIPVLGVFYGTALIADEVEDKTITYLFTRPIPRGAVLVGKYLAYLACTMLLVLPSVVLVYFADRADRRQRRRIVSLAAGGSRDARRRPGRLRRGVRAGSARASSGRSSSGSSSRSAGSRPCCCSRATSSG